MSQSSFTRSATKRRCTRSSWVAAFTRLGRPLLRAGKALNAQPSHDLEAELLAPCVGQRRRNQALTHSTWHLTQPLFA